MAKRINPYNLFVGSFIPNWLLKRQEISAWAKLTYARLGQYAGKDGEAFPLIDTLAQEIGTSKSTVERALAELKKAGLIESEQRGLNQSNRYFFLVHKWMSGKHDTSPVTVQETPPVTVQEHPPVTYIRESVEENQLRDYPDRSRERAPGARLKEKSDSDGVRWTYSGPPLADSLKRGRAH